MNDSADAEKYRVGIQGPVQGQVIGDHAHVHIYPPVHSSPSPPERIWNIPFQRNPFFLGQESLLIELHQRLTGGTTTALTQVQAISGLGGIGKTQIAIEYAYRYRDTYPFVFWIRAEHLETLTTDLASLASQLRLPEEHETDQMKVVTAVKHWLTTHAGWLLLFDNADDISLLTPFLPGRHAGAILLTTRATQTQPIAEPLQVELMDEQQGAEFLVRRARLLLAGKAFADMAPPDQQAARQICQLVGGLPLALDQAGAYIDETQCSVQDYLNFYQQDQPIRAKLLQRRGKVTTGHPEPVATTWALAFARVEQASPAAADLLRACSFLDPDLIPEELLRQGAQCWGASLASVADDPFQWNETIRELLKYALVRRSREQQALSIHRLVQTVLKDAIDQPTYRQWTEQTIRAVERVFPSGIDPANWVKCKQLLPHAQVCAILIERHDLSSAEATNLLHRMANYLHQHARYSEAEPLFLRALRIWERSLGPDHPDVAHPLHGLANLYKEQGKYSEAEPLFLRALRIWEHSLGPDHPDVASPLNGLANLYRQQGKYSEAEPLFLQALRIWEHSLGPDHPDVASPLNGLANLYRQQGKYSEAEPLYQRALHIWEHSLGPDHPDVASPLNGLAILYKQRGKYSEAESLFLRALRIWEHSLGSDHPQVASPLNNLAILYRQQGKYSEAEPLYQRALRIWECSLGPDHPRVAHPLNGLAILYKQRGKYSEAEPLYLRALRIRERSLGPDHPRVAHPLNGLAILYKQRGKYSEAEPLYLRALRIRERSLGSEHSLTRQVRNNYAILLRAMKRDVEAKQIEER